MAAISATSAYERYFTMEDGNIRLKRSIGVSGLTRIRINRRVDESYLEVCDRVNDTYFRAICSSATWFKDKSRPDLGWAASGCVLVALLQDEHYDLNGIHPEENIPGWIREILGAPETIEADNASIIADSAYDRYFTKEGGHIVLKPSVVVSDRSRELINGMVLSRFDEKDDEFKAICSSTTWFEEHRVDHAWPSDRTAYALMAFLQNEHYEVKGVDLESAEEAMRFAYDILGKPYVEIH